MVACCYIAKLSRSYLSFAAIPFVILSMACNNKAQQYNHIIHEVNGAEVYYFKTDRTVKVRIPQVEALKAILIRNIQPEEQHNIISNINITLFRDSTKIAYLHINANAQDPFVNFYSDNLNFGFRLAYGIGMFIDNLP